MAEAWERLRPIPWSEFVVPRDCQYFVKGLLEPGQHLEIYGTSGSGKTFLAMDMAFAIASGQTTWFGLKVRKAPVLYIGSEGGVASFAKRATALQEKYGIKPDKCNLHVITVAPNFGIENSADARIIAGHIKDIAVNDDAWAIFNDTLAKSMHGQSEDKAEGMGCYVGNARSFTEAGHGFSSIHHTGKVAERGSRGSYALPADVDGMMSVEKVGCVSVATVHKARDGEGGAKYSFELDQVSLGEDAEGDEINTCIVRPVDDVPRKTAATKLSDSEKLGLKALRECIADQGRPAPDSNHYPAGVSVVHVDEWRAICKQRGVLSKEAANPRTDWKRLRQGLHRKEITAQWNDLIWIV
jgi:hypothetical protein